MAIAPRTKAARPLTEPYWAAPAVTTLEVAVAEAPVALALPVALDMWVMPEWEADSVADDMDSVAEAEVSIPEPDSEAELEAEASDAVVEAADVLAGAEAAEEPEPEPTLAQKVWTAGRTWS